MEFKFKEFGSEIWVRVCHVCRTDQEICNFCHYVPKDKSKHIHHFRYVKTLIKRNILKKIFKCELKTKMYKCLCGEIKMYGYQIPINKLPDYWDEILF